MANTSITDGERVMHQVPIIDARTAEILKAIIIAYINKMEPVSSRKLAKMMNLNLSPATLRNIMADLEESGYLIQPHTSAGRIPTDHAYRFFVEMLMRETSALSEPEQDEIRQELSSLQSNNELITRDIPRIINRLSSYIGVSLSPNFRKVSIRNIHFITLDPHKVLAVIVTTPGQVYQRVLDITETFDQEELNRVSNLINTRFSDCTLDEICLQVNSMMNEERNTYNDLLNNVLLFSKKAQDTFDNDLASHHIYLEGTSTIFSLPELANVEKMKRIFEEFMEKRRLMILLDMLIQQNGITVCIGSESNNQNLEDLSIILSPYKKGNQIVGGLGVIGPTRMPYDRMIALIEYLSKLVSTLLTREEEKTFE